MFSDIPRAEGCAKARKRSLRQWLRPWRAVPWSLVRTVNGMATKRSGVVVLDADLTYLAKMELGVVPSLESHLGRSTGNVSVPADVPI